MLYRLFLFKQMKVEMENYLSNLLLTVQVLEFLHVMAVVSPQPLMFSLAKSACKFHLTHCGLARLSCHVDLVQVINRQRPKIPF